MSWPRNALVLLLASLLLAPAAGAARQGGPPSPLVAASPGGDGIGDPYFPAMGNGGYDVGHYTLDLDLDVATGAIADAAATIEATATQDLSAFDLDFRGPEITGLRVDGAGAGFRRQGGELTVTPAVPIARATPFTVEVDYRGAPDLGADRLSQGWWATPGEEIYILGEPGGADVWFPVNGHPSDKATYTMVLSVPHPWTVVANGTETEERDDGQRTTTVWEMDEPMASYLATFHAGELSPVRATGPDGLPIVHWFPPDATADERAAVARVPEMIAFFASRFGPYPFASFGGTVVDGGPEAALETQSMVVYQRSALREGSVAHELAHQWFGDSVSLARWQDVWLNEGFATYAEVLWAEHAGGVAERDRRLGRMVAIAKVSGAMAGGIAIGDPGPDHLFDPAVYARGALTLHALRLTIGDDAFFRLLRAWTDRHRYANATTADFVALAGEASGRDLRPFFAAWLGSGPLPAMPAAPAS